VINVATPIEMDTAATPAQAEGILSVIEVVSPLEQRHNRSLGNTANYAWQNNHRGAEHGMPVLVSFLFA
jgi:hypothetical protein